MPRPAGRIRQQLYRACVDLPGRAQAPEPTGVGHRLAHAPHPGARDLARIRSRAGRIAGREIALLTGGFGMRRVLRPA